MLARIVPFNGEGLPVIGLGTWQTFGVSPSDPSESLAHVLHELQHAGGTLIDNSPMYRRAETVVGTLTEASGITDRFFDATKVWTRGKEAGIR